MDENPKLPDRELESDRARRLRHIAMLAVVVALAVLILVTRAVGGHGAARQRPGNTGVQTAPSPKP